MSVMGDTLGDALQSFEVHTLEAEPEIGSFTILSLTASGIQKLAYELQQTSDDGVNDKINFLEPLLGTASYVASRMNAPVTFAGVENISVFLGSPSKQPTTYKKLSLEVIGLAAFHFGALVGSGTQLGVDDTLPSIQFECHAYRLPSEFLAARFFEWKQTQNQSEAIARLVERHLPAGVVQTWNARQQKDSLLKAGVEFSPEMDRHINGQIVRREFVKRSLSPREMNRIHESKRTENYMAVRPTCRVDDETPSLALVANLEEFLFQGDLPVSLDADIASNITP